MDRGQGRQPHNHCTEAFKLSVINIHIVTTSWLFNPSVIRALLIREMFIALTEKLGR